MAISEVNRVQIRMRMGWPPGHTEPRYDAQITRIQSVADGGVMPDSSTEDFVVVLLGKIANVETKITETLDLLSVNRADEANIDAARGTMMLRSEGRRLVAQMAFVLDAPPLVDTFSGSFQFPTSYVSPRSPSPYGAG